MEIGIGIHGEKGIYREKSETVDKLPTGFIELFKYNDNKDTGFDGERHGRHPIE